MLRLWREKKASEATYLGLAKGFECLELRDMIEQLLDLYSARRQAGGFQFQDPQQEHGVPRIGSSDCYAWLAGQPYKDDPLPDVIPTL